MGNKSWVLLLLLFTVPYFSVGQKKQLPVPASLIFSGACKVSNGQHVYVCCGELFKTKGAEIEKICRVRAMSRAEIACCQNEEMFKIGSQVYRQETANVWGRIGDL